METVQNSTVQYELFDLEEDARESSNLINDYPDITSQLIEQIEQWKESVRQSIKKVGCNIL